MAKKPKKVNELNQHLVFNQVSNIASGKILFACTTSSYEYQFLLLTFKKNKIKMQVKNTAGLWINTFPYCHFTLMWRDKNKKYQEMFNKEKVKGSFTRKFNIKTFILM